MRRLAHWFNKIVARWWRRPHPRADIPAILTPEALQAALSEARFLHAQHRVSVKVLTPGELPGLPRRADVEKD